MVKEIKHLKINQKIKHIFIMFLQLKITLTARLKGIKNQKSRSLCDFSGENTDKQILFEIDF